MSGDPAQDYFADGITENLTTELSRIKGSFVIARNTAFTYKGKSIDAKEIGKELGVRYVLEGSVQRDGARVRVNAQLIDAESGAHLWADRFEEPIADLLQAAGRDQVASHAPMQIQLVAVDAARVRRTRPQSRCGGLGPPLRGGRLQLSPGSANTRLRSTSVTGRCISTAATSLRWPA